MSHANTVKMRFAVAAVLVVAALPLCASIPARTRGGRLPHSFGVRRQAQRGAAFRIEREERRRAGYRLPLALQSGCGVPPHRPPLRCANRCADTVYAAGRVTAMAYPNAGGVARLWVTDHADALKRTLMETDANGAPVRWYVWGGGRLLAVVEADGVVRYAHSDEQGSVVALVERCFPFTK